MKAKNKVVYVPPVYEEIQHEVTSADENNVPLRASFHTDVSLLQRIDSLRADAQTLREIKESLQPMIDTSNFRAQFEDTFGSLTDDELINSCPSRYTQTASEKMSYRCELSAPLLGYCSSVAPSPLASNIDMSATYGYSPRYAELKSAVDYFEGGFCGSYASWVTGYDESFLRLWRKNLGSQSAANYGSIDDLIVS